LYEDYVQYLKLKFQAVFLYLTSPQVGLSVVAGDSSSYKFSE